MINGHKQNKRTPSWAMGISLLLHGFVLLSLGAGTFPGTGTKQGDLVVYLAMPPALPQQVLTASSKSNQMNKVESFEARHDSKDQKTPQEVKSQPVVKVNVPEEKTVAEPSLLQEARIPAKPDGTRESIETAVNKGSTNSMSEGMTEVGKGGTDSLTRNPKPGTRNSAGALLAFAGDPTTLGMIARDALGPDLIPAQPLSLPEPLYPVLSRKRGEEGRVIIEIEISAEGKVLKAQVEASSSYPRLDRAALEAVKQAEFTVATEFGRPVKSTTKVAYRFELENQ